MNLKQKIRTYNFWISLASAALLFLRILGQNFGFEIDSNAFMDIVTALCGILVVTGIITMPTTIVTKTKNEPAKETKLNQLIHSTDPESVEEQNLIEGQLQESSIVIHETVATENSDFEIKPEKSENAVEIKVQEKDENELETDCIQTTIETQKPTDIEN